MNHHSKLHNSYAVPESATKHTTPYRHVITFVEMEYFQGKSRHYQETQSLKNQHATIVDFPFEKYKKKGIKEKDR